LSPGHFLIGAPLTSFLSQTLPTQQRTAYPDGSEFNASISSYGKGGQLTTSTACSNAANGAASNQTFSPEC